MDVACITHGRDDKCVHNFVLKAQKDALDVDGMITLKWFLNVI